MSGSSAWVIGGGSGIGEAVARALARTGRHVVVSGRREDRLAQVVEAVRAEGGSASAATVDVRDGGEVASLPAILERQHGPIDVLVYSAGTNVRERFWRDLAPDALAGVMDANLTGAVRAVHAVLPGMRSRGAGRVVLVSSWAAWRFSAGAGAAYSMSKNALGVLAETLNAEEGAGGVTATHLCPGEVETDILDTRPQPPSAAERALMLRPADVGDAVGWLATLPPRVCVNELVLTPAANTSYPGTPRKDSHDPS